MTEPAENNNATDDLLEQFLHFDALGLKKESKQAVLAIIDIVHSLDAKVAWTQNNLDRLQWNRRSRIRHEFYEAIIFLALKADFDRGDPEASYLLGKYAQNLYSSPSLHAQIGQRSAMDFFRIAFQSAPSCVRYRRAYLCSLLNGLQYAFHEWPSGILIDHTNWHSELRELREQLSVASSLDSDDEFAATLAEWFENTEQYERRLATQPTVR
ncbi:MULTISPECIES: hypothetical protein [unclassified Yoonia]|uniref:hypothetical protein n=1 Tax=unclassified Yoonia TaxID=2629118 RepID=UPI002AFE71AD|nr:MULTISPECIES: hypothetical protein [unclassified Yoonia]